MTVIVLKTCISFKKFQKPRQVFQTLFRKPETKQHRASQLAELSFRGYIEKFKKFRSGQTREEEPRVALAPTSSNVLEQ